MKRNFIKFKSAQSLKLVCASIATCFLHAGAAHADNPAPLMIPQASGITANELGVVVDDNDPFSVQIADYYVKARAVPLQNIVHIAIDRTKYTSSIYAPIKYSQGTGSGTFSGHGIPADYASVLKAQVDLQLSNNPNVQALLLTWRGPWWVGQTPSSNLLDSKGNPSWGCSASITSVFAFGIGSQGPGNALCGDINVAPGYGGDGLVNPYYNSDSTAPWQDYHMRPTMMLGADPTADISTALLQAKALIDRGVASDATYPTGDGYLMRTTDNSRNKRWAGDGRLLTNYPSMTKSWAGALNFTYVDNNDSSICPNWFPDPNSSNLAARNNTCYWNNFVSKANNVLFIFEGSSVFPDVDPYLDSLLYPNHGKNTNTYLPGAVADTLTSSAGYLMPHDQTRVVDRIAAGLTGSYGTVTEPRSYPEKFSDPSVLVAQYYKGASLIEAYWKSVRKPGEGLFVGEPLARPFTDKPIQTVSADGANYEFTTRALEPNQRYHFDALVNDKWQPAGAIKSSKYQQPQSYKLPTVAGSTKTRVSKCTHSNQSYQIYVPNSWATHNQVYAGGQVASEFVLGFGDPKQVCDTVGEPVNIKSILLYSKDAKGVLTPAPYNYTFAIKYRVLSAMQFSPYVNGPPKYQITPVTNDDYVIMVDTIIQRTAVPGDYVIKMTLGNQYGETQEVSDTVTVLPGLAPAAPSLMVAYPQDYWSIPLIPPLLDANLPSIIPNTTSPGALRVGLSWNDPQANLAQFRVQLIDDTGVAVMEKKVARSSPNSTGTTITLGLTSLANSVEGGCYSCQLVVEGLDNNGTVIATKTVNNLSIY